MENKGQASAEYLLLIVVILIIMAAVTIPLVGTSIEATMDISRSTDTKNAVQNIANAVNLVYANGPGARRTVDIYIPQNGTLTADNNLKIIWMNLTLSNQNKIINASTNYNVNPSQTPVTKGWHQVRVEWQLNTNYVTVTFIN
jgi:uncharacterized protein (UPF0333 family)